MAEQNKHIDDLFRESLGNYSEVPDASVWSDIAQKLDTPPAPGTPGGGGGSGAAAMLGKGKILLMVIGAAVVFFAAKWATGNFGTSNSSKQSTEIRAEVPVTNDMPIGSMEEITPVAAEETMPVPAEVPETVPVIPAEESVTEKVAKNKRSINKSTVTQPASSKPDKSTVTKPVSEKVAPQTGAVVNKAAIANVSKEAAAQANKINKPAIADKQVTDNNATSNKIPVAASAPIAVAALPPAKPLVQPEKEKMPIAPDEPVKPTRPEELPAPVQPRIKEELSALFFKGSMVLLHSEQPDIDYGFLDTDKGLERIVKMLKRRMESGELEAGIKAGIEAGFKKYTMNKLVVMPYVRYSVSRHLSVLLQPGFKFGRLSLTDMGTSAAYYSITNSSVTTNHIIVNAADTFAVDTITRRYLYNQTYDSLSIGYATERRNYFEFELPIMLQYGITKNLSVYAGINFLFGKTIRLKEDRQEFKGLTKSNTVSYAPVPVTAKDPIPPSIDSMFTYNAMQYTGNVMPAQNPLADPLRVGYMVGVNYKIGQRWTAEVMVQQMLNNANYIPDEKVRTIHKQPYVRIGVGYRLFKDRK